MISAATPSSEPMRLIWVYWRNVPDLASSLRRSSAGTLRSGSTSPEARGPRVPGLESPNGSSESELSATTEKTPWPPLASCSTRPVSQVAESWEPRFPVRAASSGRVSSAPSAIFWATLKPPTAWLCAACALAVSRPLRTWPTTTTPSSRTTASDISLSLIHVYKRQAEEPQQGVDRTAHGPVGQQLAAAQQPSDQLTRKGHFAHRADGTPPLCLRGRTVPDHLSSARPCSRHRARSPRSPDAPDPARPWNAAAARGH